MNADETPLWTQLISAARDSASAEDRGSVVGAGTAKALTELVLREARVVREERQRVRWLWRVACLGLAASLLVGMSVDWRVLLPSDACPLQTAQLVSEEFLP